MGSVSTILCVLFEVAVTLMVVVWMQCSVASAVEITISPAALKELTLTPQEKVAFDRFKGIVYKDLTYDYDFIKQDLYLLRWIRAKNLDVDNAVKEMRQFVVFLRENRIDTILQEDWSDLIEEYPYVLNFTDRQGRPVAYGAVGGDSWNVRRGILQGKRARLMRYIYRLVFEINQKLIDIGKKQPNVTQFVLIMNLEGFNYQQTCPLCISSYIALLDSYERFIPGYAHEIIVINAPQAHVSFSELMKPFHSKSTREALKIFNSNRKLWGPYLKERIDPKFLKEIVDL